jgi:anti-sigma factor RsiW
VTCKEFIEFLAAYLERELPSAEIAAFDAHLGVCPDCVDYLRTYRDAIALGRIALAVDADDAELPADAPDALVRAVLAMRPRS